MRERHDDDCTNPYDDAHEICPTPARETKRRPRPPQSISVRENVYEKIQAYAKSRGLSVSEVVDAIITKALNDWGDS